MNKRHIISGFICLFILSAIWGTSAPAEVLNRVVAVVNDELITLHELNLRIREFTGLPPEKLRSRGEAEFLRMRRNILEALIDEKITQETIKELGIEVTPKQIDATVEKIKQENNRTHEELLASLEREGISYESYRKRIKNEIERSKLINYEVKSKIIIREEMIQEYYEENIKDFTNESSVRLAGIIFLRRKPNDKKEFDEIKRRADSVMTRLGEGEDFVQLAKTLSEGPGADRGGDLGVFQMDQLNPELEKALQGLGEGDVTAPIIRPDSVQIFKIMEKNEGARKSLDEVRNSIHRKLYNEEVNKRYITWIDELRKTAYIKIIF